MMLTTGARLGPYEIAAPIGSGGMGEVFRARDTRLGRDVALKVLPALFTADSERLRRFEQEARATATLNHPNILVVHDVGAHEGIPYVVSELLEGQTLREILERGPLPSRKAVDYGIQIASGLAAAHDKGIVHRDLKPENLLVTKDGRVKILDFGLAKLVEAASSESSRETIAHTDPGMVVGTAGYMSPEQLRAEPVDARSDVFSLGAVLYEMFTGERAFKGKTAVDTISAILREDPADFPSGVHAGSPALERIVRRCLEKSVDERFQSARDIRFALEAMSSASGLKQPAIDAAPPKRGRRVLPVAALLAAAVFGAVMYVAGARSGSGASSPPSITQLTFRNGTVRGARFAPDGRTVIYGAAWEGEPITLFTTRPGNAESSPLQLPPSDLLGMSSTGEMAIALGAQPAGTFTTVGTLARVPIAGGAPRELREGISAADWSPDGSQLAIIQAGPDFGRLEFPMGTERHSTPYWLSNVRVAPDGQQVAFIAHPFGGDEGEVQVIGKTGAPRTLSKGWISLQGLAWAPGGREVWFTGTRAGMMRALWGVTLEGEERLIYRAPSRLTLEDIAPDGRVLLSGTTLHSEMRTGSLRDRAERSLSWFDWGTGLTMSLDGRLVAFTESGEGAGDKYGVFIRPIAGGPALRVADGSNAAISPDGKSVAFPADAGRRVHVVPTGAGAPRIIDSGPVTVQYAGWFPDGRRLLVNGNEAGRQPRTYEVGIASGTFTAVTPEGTTGRMLSPDGQWLPGIADGSPAMMNLRTGKRLAPQSVPPVVPGDRGRVVGWSSDSSALFLAAFDERSARLFRLEVPSMRRTEIGRVEPHDRAGFIAFGGLVLAGDGDRYAYLLSRQRSQLYLLQLDGQ